jgi:hypothetical protein
MSYGHTYPRPLTRDAAAVASLCASAATIRAIFFLRRTAYTNKINEY